MKLYSKGIYHPCESNIVIYAAAIVREQASSTSRFKDQLFLEFLIATNAKQIATYTHIHTPGR